jgi:parvulin-like peptidyl-prolyl isomerase
MTPRIWLVVSLALACDKAGSQAATMGVSTTASATRTEDVARGDGTSPILPSAGATSSAEPALPDTIIAQHVLVAYRGAKRAPKGVTRTKVEAKARANEVVSKIRSGTSFEDAVKTYSDDSSSVDRVGSLGKFHKSDMDPAFGNAAFALKVGEVSDAVETPFGFHVIKRTQ